MAVYKLKATGNYGDMPKGFKFQVISTTIPTPSATTPLKLFSWPFMTEKIT